MKALSIRQPWADLIILGIKDIENRTWRTQYRGTLLIHAAQQLDERGEWLLCSTPGFKDDMNALYRTCGHVSQRGFIIGTVELFDCVSHHSSKWFFGPYGFVLKNPVKFENAIPFSGRLGIFTVPDEVMG